MSNYIVYKNKVVVHPGAIIEEEINHLGISQEDFAKKMGTTPKTLSKIVNGEQNLTFEMALKLSKMLGTTVESWINIQNKFDYEMAEIHFQMEGEKERKLFKSLDYNYFTKNFNYYDKDDDDFNTKLENVRQTLLISDLLSLKDIDLTTSFKKSLINMSEMDIVKANIMTQLAIRQASEIDAPKFNRKKLNKAIDKILYIPYNSHTISKVSDILLEVGIKLVVIPHYPKAKVKGACKKTVNSIVLMISDKYLSKELFYPTLFHELGHIVNGDLGISHQKDRGEREEKANAYTLKMLNLMKNKM